MKQYYLLLLWLIPFGLISQKSPEYFNPTSQFVIAQELCDNGEYEDALTILNKIHINDSVYYEAIKTKTNCHLNLENNDSVIHLCNIALRNAQCNNYYFYLYKGIVYLRTKAYLKAIDVYEESLKEYPKSYLFYSNIGLAYQNIEQYDKAIASYKKSILLNPYFSEPHLKLGWICYQADLISQALLCFNTYLWITPTANNALDVLNFMNEMVSSKNNTDIIDLSIDVDDDSFEEIDLLLNNYAALSKKYKIDNKVDIPLVKQNHALMEKLDEYEGNGGFWDTRYVPFYKAIFEAGHFDVLMYRILSESTNKKIAGIVKKEKGKHSDFVDWSAAKWVEILGTKNKKRKQNGDRILVF